MSDLRPEPAPDSHTRGAVVVFTLALVVATIAVAYLFQSFVADFILAALFAGMLAPAHGRLTVRVKDRRRLAAALVTIGLAIAIAIPTTFVVTSLSVEAVDAAQRYGENKDSLSLQKLKEWVFGDNVVARTAARVLSVFNIEYSPKPLWALAVKAGTAVYGTVVSFLAENVKALLANVAAFVYHFAIMLLLTFYLLLDGRQLKAFMFRFSPLPDAEEELLVSRFLDVGRATLFGNGVGSLIQGVLGGIAMAVAGVPSAVLLGTIMTVFAFLPLVGISVVVIPAAIYLAVEQSVAAAIGFSIFCAIVAVIVENVVKTRLIGSRMKMHDFTIFLSIMGGLSLFGILGLLYGPLIAALFLTLANLYLTEYKQRIVGPAPD